MKKIPQRTFPKEFYPNFGLRGKKHSEETKKKISIAESASKKAFYKTKEGIEKARQHSLVLKERKFRLGYCHTKETKLKIKDSLNKFFLKKFPNGIKCKKEREIEKLELLAGRKKPNQCEICGSTKIICFDHDHKTGKFRGWICQRCNLVLGLMGDNSSLLKGLADYLNK